MMNIFSCNDLWPDSTKPLSELILIDVFFAIDDFISAYRLDTIFKLSDKMAQDLFLF